MVKLNCEICSEFIYKVICESSIAIPLWDKNRLGDCSFSHFFLLWKFSGLWDYSPTIFYKGNPYTSFQNKRIYSSFIVIISLLSYLDHLNLMFRFFFISSQKCQSNSKNIRIWKLSHLKLNRCRIKWEPNAKYNSKCFITNCLLSTVRTHTNTQHTHMERLYFQRK